MLKLKHKPSEILDACMSSYDVFDHIVDCQKEFDNLYAGHENIFNHKAPYWNIFWSIAKLGGLIAVYDKFGKDIAQSSVIIPILNEGKRMSEEIVNEDIQRLLEGTVNTEMLKEIKDSTEKDCKLWTSVLGAYEKSKTSFYSDRSDNPYLKATVNVFVTNYLQLFTQHDPLSEKQTQEISEYAYYICNTYHKGVTKKLRFKRVK